MTHIVGLTITYSKLQCLKKYINLLNIKQGIVAIKYKKRIK